MGDYTESTHPRTKIPDVEVYERPVYTRREDLCLIFYIGRRWYYMDWGEKDYELLLSSNIVTDHLHGYWDRFLARHGLMRDAWYSDITEAVLPTGNARIWN